MKDRESNPVMADVVDGLLNFLSRIFAAGREYAASIADTLHTQSITESTEKKIARESSAPDLSAFL